MKKTFLWSLILLLSISMIAMFTVTGCKEEEAAVAEAEEEVEEEVEEAAPAEETKTIAVIVPGVENPFFGTMQVIAAAKCEELGYETIKLVHDDDANKQLEQFETVIAQGVSAIILDNAGAEATNAAVELANENGIGCFLVDREITKEGIAVSQIVSNNFQGATILAEYFVELMGEEGTYVELTGRDTDTNAHVRSDGYHSVIDTYPDMVMVGQQTANWSQDEGKTVTETLIQQNPDVKGIICGNDTMALGAQAALLTADLDDVICVGFDGSDEAIESILKGELEATSLQPVAEMANQAAIQADEWIRTGSTGKDEKQSIDMVLLTPENAGDYEGFAPK